MSENCKAVLAGLAGKLEDINEDYPATEFSTLRTDFLSILSLLYAASTKVALALKPDAKAHHAAALVPLRDLSNNVAALLYSIRLMRQTQGSTLLAEYENIARDIISSIEHFAEGLHNSLSQANSNDHFVAVAKVHELIDNAKKSGAMSLDNKTAVRKKLIQDHETLMDVAEEIEEMRQSSGPDDEEGFDDGWEELGLKSNQELSQEERDRLEKVSITNRSFVSNPLFCSRCKLLSNSPISCMNAYKRISCLLVHRCRAMPSWIASQNFPRRCLSPRTISFRPCIHPTKP